jgi:hypothetical protein
MLRLLCRNERYVKVNTNSLRLICITLQCAVQLVVALTRCSGFRQLSAKELGRLPFLEYLHVVKNGIWSLITNVSSCLASLSVSPRNIQIMWSLYIQYRIIPLFISLLTSLFFHAFLVPLIFLLPFCGGSTSEMVTSHYRAWWLPVIANCHVRHIIMYNLKWCYVIIIIRSTLSTIWCPKI